jgi:DNA-directed RNA polymerase specialized sigma24 family protein
LENGPDYNALFRACKSGDTAARESLFRHLQVRLRSILKYRLRGWPVEELDDILQDTMLVVTEKLDQVESNPHYYALDVLRKKIGSSISRRRRRVNLSIDPTGGEEREDDGTAGGAVVLPGEEMDLTMLESAEIAAAIRRAIHHLSPLCQALFAALIENRSIAETWDLFSATESGLRRSTFDKRVFDCRRKLRRLLKGTIE